MNPRINDQFLADVERIKAECRARRAELAALYRAPPKTDEQWDHDREAWRNGEGEL